MMRNPKRLARIVRIRQLQEEAARAAWLRCLQAQTGGRCWVLRPCVASASP